MKKMKYVTISAKEFEQETEFDVIKYKDKKYLRLSLYSPVTYAVIIICMTPITKTEEGFDYFYVIRLSDDQGVMRNKFTISNNFIKNGMIDVATFAKKALDEIKHDVWVRCNQLQEISNKFVYSNIDISNIDINDVEDIDLEDSNLTSYCMKTVVDIEENKDNMMSRLFDNSCKNYGQLIIS